ncbi:MAG: patatin-like phospholipase family protein [Ktedonobacterales bacterium]
MRRGDARTVAQTAPGRRTKPAVPVPGDSDTAEQRGGSVASDNSSDGGGKRGDPLRGRYGVHRPRWSGYTAFVLSGGGARGALQVGALRALLEAGERPDVVIGTSIGAWNGALLARDPTLDGVEVIAEAWRGAHPARVLLGVEPPASSPAQAVAAMRALTAVRRLAAGQPSLYSDAGMRQLIGGLLGRTRFEELAVPLRVIATDITHGTRAVFGGGPVAPAVLASSAIPGIFPPVRLGSSVYVDGGALDNASIETALALGARRIFVLDVGYDGRGSHASLWSEVRPRDGAPRRSAGVLSVAAVLERTTQVVSRYQLNRALHRVPAGIEVHVLSVGASASGGALEFEKARRWIETGYAFTLDYLAQARAQERAATTASPR